MQLLSTRDKFPINRIFLLNTLKNVKNIGRFEIFNFRGRKIIVDGAHNPQKMKAFISSLISLYPDKFFNFYIAFKEDKDYVEMLKLIIPHALNIFVSDFIVKNIDTRAISIPAEEVKKAIEKTGFKNVKIIKNNEVFSSIMEGKTDVVITGSLYFISQLYLNNTFFRNR